MKKDIHPKNYKLVVFKDMSNDVTFLSRSTINTKETIKWEDGNEYPPGRVDKFNNKYKKFFEKKETK